jgi:hypothetical protein
MWLCTASSLAATIQNTHLSVNWEPTKSPSAIAEVFVVFGALEPTAMHTRLPDSQVLQYVGRRKTCRAVSCVRLTAAHPQVRFAWLELTWRMDLQARATEDVVYFVIQRAPRLLPPLPTVPFHLPAPLPDTAKATVSASSAALTAMDAKAAPVPPFLLWLDAETQPRVVVRFGSAFFLFQLQGAGGTLSVERFAPFTNFGSVQAPPTAVLEAVSTALCTSDRARPQSEPLPTLGSIAALMERLSVAAVNCFSLTDKCWCDVFGCVMLRRIAVPSLTASQLCLSLEPVPSANSALLQALRSSHLTYLGLDVCTLIASYTPLSSYPFACDAPVRVVFGRVYETRIEQALVRVTIRRSERSGYQCVVSVRDERTRWDHRAFSNFKGSRELLFDALHVRVTVSDAVGLGLRSQPATPTPVASSAAAPSVTTSPAVSVASAVFPPLPACTVLLQPITHRLVSAGIPFDWAAGETIKVEAAFRRAFPALKDTEELELGLETAQLFDRPDLLASSLAVPQSLALAADRSADPNALPIPFILLTLHVEAKPQRPHCAAQLSVRVQKSTSGSTLFIIPVSLLPDFATSKISVASNGASLRIQSYHLRFFVHDMAPLPIPPTSQASALQPEDVERYLTSVAQSVSDPKLRVRVSYESIP